MHQRLRCAGHGNVDLICPVGRVRQSEPPGNRRRVGRGSDVAPQSVASGVECASVCPLYGAILDRRQMAGCRTPTLPIERPQPLHCCLSGQRREELQRLDSSSPVRRPTAPWRKRSLLPRTSPQAALAGSAPALSIRGCGSAAPRCASRPWSTPTHCEPRERSPAAWQR